MLEPIPHLTTKAPPASALYTPLNCLCWRRDFMDHSYFRLWIYMYLFFIFRRQDVDTAK